jgi:TPR repeat protein
MHLLEGNGVPRNLVMAETHLRQAARMGYSAAMLALARMHHSGQGAAPSQVEAALWYRAAGDAGEAEAQFALGALLARGEGVPKRVEDSARWFERAASRARRGTIQYRGVLPERHRGRATRQRRRVCPRRRAGHDRRRPNSASFTLRGGRAADHQAAALRLRGPPRPARRGRDDPGNPPPARHRVERDAAVAEQLLRRAADRGYGPALLQLGHFYAQDRGTGTNRPEASGAAAPRPKRNPRGQLIVAHNSLTGNWGARDAAAAARGTAGRRTRDMPGRSSSSA